MKHLLSALSLYDNTRFFYITMIVTLVVFALPPRMSYAQAAGNCNIVGPINLIYKNNTPEAIDEALKNGCPIPAALKQGANGKGRAIRPTVAKVELNAISTRTAAKPVLSYKNGAGVCNTYEPTMPGGEATNGGKTPCDLGAGSSLCLLSGRSCSFISNTPILNEDEKCATNFMNLVLGLAGGGKPDISAKASVSKNCVSGSFGICGLGTIGGKICANGTKSSKAADDGLPFSKTEPPEYVEVNNVAELLYINNTINQGTAIFFPEGAVVTINGQNYTIEKEGFITMSPKGIIYFGVKNGNGYSEPTEGIELKQDEAVTITPTQGIAQVGVDIYKGGTIGTGGVLQRPTTVTAESVPKGSTSTTGKQTTAVTGGSPTIDPNLLAVAPELLAGPNVGSNAPRGTLAPDVPPVGIIPATTTPDEADVLPEALR